jgi:chromosome segregation ATPase
VAEAQGKLTNGHSPGASAEEVTRILSETEGKYEARIGDLRSKMRGLEKERHEAEDEWSRNLQERSRELERLRGLVEAKDREYAESMRRKTETDEQLIELEADNRRLKAQAEAEKGILLGLQKDIDWLRDAEVCPPKLQGM